MVEAVTEMLNPFKTEVYSLVGNSKFLDGSPIAPNMVSQFEGVSRFKQYEELSGNLYDLTHRESSSLFHETFSAVLESTFEKTESLGLLTENVTLETDYDPAAGGAWSRQLEQIAKLIKVDTTELANERAAFVTMAGGWDTHATADLTGLLDPLNTALDQFVKELKAQKLWNNVTILCVSDFGRTLTTNAQGTDHAWGGNYFMLGGSLKGEQILGKYPAHLDVESSEEVSHHGRVVPTTPWESVWHGLSDWWGINVSDPAVRGKLLPNAANFAPEQLFHAADLFHKW
jgi:cullin-associated NEDD8-dissociated protein 1